jgi:hypothetical protein
MNTESIDCRLVKFGTVPEAGGLERPGDYTFAEDEATLYVWLPGMGGPDALQIRRGSALAGTAERGHVWGWNGSVERPTLTPSIHAPGQWHGYLTDGRLVSC